MLFLGLLLYMLFYVPCTLLGLLLSADHSVAAGAILAGLLSGLSLLVLSWFSRTYQPEWRRTLRALAALKGVRSLCFLTALALALVMLSGEPGAFSVLLLLPVGFVSLVNWLGWEWHPLCLETSPDLVVGPPGKPVAPPSIWPSPEIAESVIVKNFEWTYKGVPYSISLPIRRSVYEDLKGRQRVVDCNAWSREYVSLGVTGEIRDLSMRLTRLGHPFRSYDEVSLTLAFVQQTVEYTREQGEYPRYPVETLVEQRGDCEDFSIVAAALLHTMGYQVALLYVPGHAALGVAGAAGIEGVFKEHGGCRYYYCEMTGEGWKIGQLPAKYEASQIEVSPIPVQPLRVVRAKENASGTAV